ncbi:efflux RND transporter periplasmic adaptor subunit [Burkholderia sp. S171]|uniref:efflux RND transporter periplasmic adaptor subunit n=1 Tax=Burkholderia sp. S171 TaxID=1641860 RepID=UPI00131BA731|nr:efflux RND transporter periplasmic adaptor subunit [Burkholderia sp. S171]
MKQEHVPLEPAAMPVRAQGRDRRKLPALVLAVAVVLALSTFWLWPRHPPVALVSAVPVDAGHAVLRDFPIRVDAVGTVQALNLVDVKVRVDGQLARIAFREGQDVQAGQVLAQLDQGPLTAQLHQAQAAQRKDQASLDNARLDLARFSKLVGIGAATSQSADTAKSQVESLVASVAADAALVQSDQLQLDFTTLYAPFTGRAGAREADLGAIVHPADTTGVVTVTQMEPITVLFSVPQDALPEVLANQAKAPLTVRVTSRSGGEALAEGTLVFIDSIVDASTGQIKMKASFTNRDRKLWPGELVNAQVLVRTSRQRLAVPSRAVINSQSGTQLYTITPNGEAQLRPVRTGLSVDGMTEILGGVAAGERVVFDGQSRLNPGTRVNAKIIAAAPDVPGGSGGSGGSGVSSNDTVGDPS